MKSSCTVPPNLLWKGTGRAGHSPIVASQHLTVLVITHQRNKYNTTWRGARFKLCPRCWKFPGSPALSTVRRRWRCSASEEWKTIRRRRVGRRSRSRSCRRIRDTGAEQTCVTGWFGCAPLTTCPTPTLRGSWWTARLSVSWMSACSLQEFHSEANSSTETSRSDLPTPYTNTSASEPGFLNLPLLVIPSSCNKNF